MTPFLFHHLLMPSKSEMLLVMDITFKNDANEMIYILLRKRKYVI